MTNLGMQEFMKAIVSGNTIQSHVFEISLCNSSGHILYFMTVFEELYYMQTWYSKQCFVMAITNFLFVYSVGFSDLYVIS